MHPLNHSSLDYRRGRHLGPQRPGPRGGGEKPHESRCPHCGATYGGGRWQWAESEAEASALCPACRRIEHGDAAHVLCFVGLPLQVVDELTAVVHRIAAAESGTHPMERLMVRPAPPDQIRIGTTGPHLARRLLAGVLRAWRRQLEVTHTDDVSTVLRWLGPMPPAPPHLS